MTELLLRTIHGSHLYGLAHEGSDRDWYAVHGEKTTKSRQNIIDNEDTVTVSYDRFLRLCEKGVPQALEAMFSRKALVDTIPFIRASFVATGPVVRSTYERTIKNFWAREDRKRRRHALRLTVNYASIVEMGRFNPTLTLEEIEMVNAFCDNTDGLEIVRRMYGV